MCTFCTGLYKKGQRSSLLLRLVQTWPSSVGGDIWDERDNAKVLNKNHPFWSELAKENSAAAGSTDTFFFFNLSTLSHLSSISSFFPSLSHRSVASALTRITRAIWPSRSDRAGLKVTELPPGKGCLPGRHLFFDLAVIGLCRCD